MSGLKREVIDKLGTDQDGLVEWLAIASQWQKLGEKSYVLDGLVVHLHRVGTEPYDPPSDSDEEDEDKDEDEDDEENEEEEEEDPSPEDFVLTICKMKNGQLDSYYVSGEHLAVLTREDFINLVRRRIAVTKDLLRPIELADDGILTVKGVDIKKFLKKHGADAEFKWLNRYLKYLM